MITNIYLTHTERPNKIIIVCDTDDYCWDKTLILRYLILFYGFKFNFLINYKCRYLNEVGVIMNQLITMYLNPSKLLQLFTKDNFNKELLTKDNINWIEINEVDIEIINIIIKNPDLIYKYAKEIEKQQVKDFPGYLSQELTLDKFDKETQEKYNDDTKPFKDNNYLKDDTIGDILFTSRLEKIKIFLIGFNYNKILNAEEIFIETQKINNNNTFCDVIADLNNYSN